MLLPVLFSLCILSILYTYFGYPLLLWLMTRRRPLQVSVRRRLC